MAFDFCNATLHTMHHALSPPPPPQIHTLRTGTVSSKLSGTVFVGLLWSEHVVLNFATRVRQRRVATFCDLQLGCGSIMLTFPTFHCYLTFDPDLCMAGSWGSSVSTVSGCGLDDRAIGVRSRAGARDFSSSLCVQTGCGAHPASCPVGRGSFPRG
jgi:hypothetical protein